LSAMEAMNTNAAISLWPMNLQGEFAAAHP
jgi:hypothetical protein